MDRCGDPCVAGALRRGRSPGSPLIPLVDAQGRLLYFLGVQYDVTNEVKAGLEIGDLKAKLRDLA